MWEISYKWYDIGICLNVSQDDLNAIKMERNDDLKECLREILKIWLMRVAPRPTLQELAETLKSNVLMIGCPLLAEKIPSIIQQLHQQKNQVALSTLPKSEYRFSPGPLSSSLTPTTALIQQTSQPHFLLKGNSLTT